MSDRRRPPKQCLECGEIKPIEGRGLCNRCWQHLRYHGRLDEYARAKRSPSEWFAMINTSNTRACWPWPGHIRSQTGYGWTGSELAHRWIYERFVGPIPASRQVDHTCHNRDRGCPGGRACVHRACVNPAHLEVVSQPENLRRSRDRFDTCKRGHLIERDSDGRWACRECRLDGRRRNWALNREEINRRRREAYARRQRESHS